MKRRLWIGAAVWVVFWSLYPTFGRPRAFYTTIRTGVHQLEACEPIPNEKERQDCWGAAGGRMQQQLDTITLRNEYAGYLPLWLVVGVGVPLVGALAWMMSKRRKLA